MLGRKYPDGTTLTKINVQMIVITEIGILVNVRKPWYLGIRCTQYSLVINSLKILVSNPLNINITIYKHMYGRSFYLVSYVSFRNHQGHPIFISNFLI